MVANARRVAPIRAGDKNGYGSVYDSSGKLVGAPGESYLEVREGWDMNVRSPWRRVVPTILFMGFSGRARSKLYITTQRIVLIREIDPWRQLAGEMTVLGAPTAIAEEAELRKSKAAGVRQFCVVQTSALKRISSRKYTKRGSRLDLKLLGNDEKQYAISFWKTYGNDHKMLSLIEEQFTN